jgi:hypothetical protein
MALLVRPTWDVKHPTWSSCIVGAYVTGRALHHAAARLN